MANFEDAIMRDTRANQPAAGIPGRLYYVTDENVTERDNGSAWEDYSDAGSGGGGGAVVAVKSAIKTDTQSTTTGNGSWVDVTGLSITYTPTSSSNKILVQVNVQVGNEGGQNSTLLRLVRDSTAIGVGDAAGSRTQASAHAYQSDSGNMLSVGMSVLDAPGDTSSHTYKVQFGRATGAGGTSYINRSHTDANAAYVARTASTITIMEVTP